MRNQLVYVWWWWWWWWWWWVHMPTYFICSPILWIDASKETKLKSLATIK